MSDEPNKPTSIVYIAGAIVLAFVVVAAILALVHTNLPDAGPTQAERQWSEVLRNYGFIVVGVVGVGLALWRGGQTQRQIEQTQEQFQATADREAVRRDEDTYREASQLLANKDSAISLAGVTLLTGLESDSTAPAVGMHSKRLLDAYTDIKILYDGKVARDIEIFGRRARGGQNFYFGNKCLFNVIRETFFISSPVEIIFRSAIIKNVLFSMIGNDHRPFQVQNCFVHGYILLGTMYIEFSECEIDTLYLDSAHQRVRFSGCYFTDTPIDGLKSMLLRAKEDLVDVTFKDCAAMRESAAWELFSDMGVQGVEPLEDEQAKSRFRGGMGHVGIFALTEKQLTDDERERVGFPLWRGRSN